MSAFIVSNDHIDAILTVYQKYIPHVISQDKYIPHVISQDNLTNLGKTLLLQNAVSVGCRYGEPTEMDLVDAYQFKLYASQVSLIQAIKLCECLNYQSCETDNYYDTPAFEKLQRIKSTLIGELPSYDDARWSI